MTKVARTSWLASIAALSLALAQVLTASAAPVRFGAKLTTDTQPQPALWCDEPNEDPPHPTCTWVMNEAFGRPTGGHKAPKAGTIGKVRLMSCEPGSLKVQVVRKSRGSETYRVISNGPTLDYQGDPEGCGEDDDGVYPVETFSTGFSVAKGDRIAIRADRTGTLRCGSGGDHTWLFDPTLPVGGVAREPDDDQGCFLLVEWQYR
jgi:hypothetical protein